MMDNLVFFEDKKIRRILVSDLWYYSIVDVIAILSESKNSQTYWRVLKKRLKDEGNETVTNCNALKMISPDGKMRLTDVANTKELFRVIQSIPSKKAEPFKLWLAKVGYERIQEIADPSISLDRARKTWIQHGRSKNWVQQRMMS